jgi:hypothetical protein
MLAYYYPPDAASGAARPHRLAKYLMQLGHRVDVIAAGVNDQPLVDSHVHRVRGELEEHPKKDAPAYIERVFRKFIFAHDPGVTWIPRVVWYAAPWINGGPPPVVISTAPPITTHLAAMWLCKQYDLRWIADFRDPVSGNPFRARSKKVDARLEPLLIRRPDAVIANTDAVAEIWRSKYPHWRDKIHVLWNGFDPEEQISALPLPARDYRVLAHVGSIYGARNPSLILSAFDRLISERKLDPRKVKIELAGPMLLKIDTAMLERLERSGALHLTPERIPHDEARQLTTTADFLLLLDVTGEGKGLQVPAKIFEYVRIGRPILACTSRNSPVDRILLQSGLTVTSVYNDDHPSDVDRKILGFLNYTSEVKTPTEWFSATFNGLNQAQWMSELIESL